MPLPFQDSELDADLNIESMPALALTCSKEYGTSSFFEQVEQEQVELYRLAVVDEATGIPMRIATATDIAEGFEFFTSQLTSPKPNTMTKVSSDANVSTETAKEATKEDNRHMTLQELLATRCSGPECDHCGALESPQWRRGPEEKPILCNACGTRFRRTNQLGPPVPSDQRKRPMSSVCAQEAATVDEKMGRPGKEPRLVV